jgi:flagellar biogenesis protein FliO
MEPLEEVILQQPSMGSLLFRIVLSLIVVLLLVYGLLRLIRKQNQLRLNQKNWIRIHDYFSLGINRGVYLMEVMSRIYVVAMAEGHVRILREMDPDDPEWETLKDALAQDSGRIFPDFKEFFRRNRSGKSFQSELDRQMQRSRRLSQKIKGEQRNEDK